jgi:Protein of unknown function (DUF3800)
MHIFYIDESYDDQNFVVSAVGFRATNWRFLLTAIQDFRQQLREQFGIKITREIHASRFIRDCSDDIADRKLNLGERKRAFELCLRHLAALENTVRVINVCLKVPGRDRDLTHMYAIQRLINRIERTMDAKNSHAILVFDEGKEAQITRQLRKMAVYNPIPSQFGTWRGGTAYKNITLARIIEDPVFRPSNRSYFLQCADHAAFTLLKRESPPTPFIKKWGYHRLFSILAPLRFLQAAPRDPDGIVR